MGKWKKRKKRRPWFDPNRKLIQRKKHLLELEMKGPDPRFETEILILRDKIRRTEARIERKAEKRAEVIRKKEVRGIPLTVYQQRDKDLQEIGYGTYKAYLLSKLWYELRYVVLSKAKCCAMCGGEKQCVHHSGYAKETLLGKRLDQLHALCLKCHRNIEFDGKKKRTFEEANRIFDMVRLAR